MSVRLAVLGGTGFLGYAFVREALRRGLDPVVYTGSPGGLANLARHRVEIRPLRPRDLATLDLPEDVDLVVNFAHPFTPRDGMSPEEQALALEHGLLRTLEKRRLIHLSTIAVYEPFDPPGPRREDDLAAPPRNDAYAVTKLRLDRLLAARAPDRVLLLRPTVVYGPFNRYWTDNFLSAFASGDVTASARGRIQPLHGDDLARFLADAAESFRPGLYNLGGPEEMAWADYFRFFQRIVGRGAFIEGTPAPPERPPEPLQDLRDLVRTPPFRRLAGRLPARVRALARRVLGRRPALRTVPVAPLPEPAHPAPRDLHFDPRGARQLQDMAADGYFARDRLVDLARLRRDFPDFRPGTLEDHRAGLADYLAFRFTDRVLR